MFSPVTIHKNYYENAKTNFTMKFFFCFLFSVILNSLLVLNSGFLIRHFLSTPGFPPARERHGVGSHVRRLMATPQTAAV